MKYGEALVELAQVAPFRTVADREAVVKTIQVEHGLYVRPEAETLAEELEQLRAMKAAKDAEELAAAQAAEVAELRAALGHTTPANDGDQDEDV